MYRSPWPVSRRAGLFVVLLGLSLSCTQADIAGPELSGVEALSEATGFAQCAPLGAAAAIRYVNPGVWDTLRVGPHRLIFQPGSLAQRTLISAPIGHFSRYAVHY
jgi:hypothetical protein